MKSKSVNPTPEPQGQQGAFPLAAGSAPSGSELLNEVTIFGVNYDGALTGEDDDYYEGHEPEVCPTCRGSGQYDDCTPCPDCDGDGTCPW